MLIWLHVKIGKGRKNIVSCLRVNHLTPMASDLGITSYVITLHISIYVPLGYVRIEKLYSTRGMI